MSVIILKKFLVSQVISELIDLDIINCYPKFLELTDVERIFWDQKHLQETK